MIPNPDPSTMPVAERTCDRCLLGGSPLVPSARVEEIIADCEATGRAFVCHRASINGEYVVCRSFYERGLSLAVVLARKLGAVRFVPLPATEEGGPVTAAPPRPPRRSRLVL